MDPYTTFVYGIRSPYTKDSYCRRLRGFFDAINLGKGNTLGERCNIFVHKGRADPNWAFNNIIRFLHYQKERIGKKEITAGTLHNYVKTLKMFCEITDIAIPWKKITRGLPRAHLMAYMTHSLSVRQIMEHSTYCAIPFLQVLAFYDAVVEGE